MGASELLYFASAYLFLTTSHIYSKETKKTYWDSSLSIKCFSPLTLVPQSITEKKLNHHFN